jgi:hypothetical protein
MPIAFYTSDGGPKPKMTPAKLRLATASMGKRETNVASLCEEIGITRQTLYRYVAAQGVIVESVPKRTLRKRGQKPGEIDAFRPLISRCFLEPLWHGRKLKFSARKSMGVATI